MHHMNAAATYQDNNFSAQTIPNTESTHNNSLENQEQQIIDTTMADKASEAKMDSYSFVSHFYAFIF